MDLVHELRTAASDLSNAATPEQGRDVIVSHPWGCVRRVLELTNVNPTFATTGCHLAMRRDVA